MRDLATSSVIASGAPEVWVLSIDHAGAERGVESADEQVVEQKVLSSYVCDSYLVQNNGLSLKSETSGRASSWRNGELAGSCAHRYTGHLHGLARGTWQSSVAILNGLKCGMGVSTTTHCILMS